jgi:hypothetical protein
MINSLKPVDDITLMCYILLKNSMKICYILQRNSIFVRKDDEKIDKNI